MTNKVELPELLSSDVFEQLKTMLAEEISSTDELQIDASIVSRLTTPCAQLLASFLQTRNSKKQQTQIISASDAFSAAWSDLGLTTQFTLGV